MNRGRERGVEGVRGRGFMGRGAREPKAGSTAHGTGDLRQPVSSDSYQHIVVIGSGFAGLAAALRLRHAGAEVTVLDKLPRTGGKAALGWPEFSSGPTVVTMPQVFRALHRRLGWEAPHLSPAQPTTTYHALERRTFAPQALAVAGSLEPTLAQLSPAEGRRYAELLHLSRAMYEGAAGTFLFAPPPTLPALGRYALRHGLSAKPWQSLASLIESGPLLTQFWLRFATYLGADPYRAPAVLHNIPWVELGGGVWHLEQVSPRAKRVSTIAPASQVSNIGRPEVVYSQETDWHSSAAEGRRQRAEGTATGLLGLAERLTAEAERLGVRFVRGAEVQRLQTEGGRVVAAITTAGEEYAADGFVSAVDVALTRRMLGAYTGKRAQGVSGFALQLRLTEDMGRGHHIFWPTDYAGEWQDIRAGRLPLEPTLYLHLHGRQGFLLVNAPATPRCATNRREYAAYLLRLLARRFPLPIAEALALAPADYARTAATGALYGAAPHGLLGSLRTGWKVGGPHGTPANLRQVGGTVHPGGGVPLSMLGGWNGAGDLLGLPYDALGGADVLGADVLGADLRGGAGS